MGNGIANRSPWMPVRNFTQCSGEMLSTVRLEDNKSRKNRALIHSVVQTWDALSISVPSETYTDSHGG